MTTTKEAVTELIQYKTPDGRQVSTVLCEQHRKFLFSFLRSEGIGASGCRAGSLSRCDVCETGQGLRGALEALAPFWEQAQEWEQAYRPRDDDDWSHGWNVGVKSRVADPDVVEQAAGVIYQSEYRQPISEAFSQDSPGCRFARKTARALIDAGLLADPEVSERAEWLLRWVQRDRDGMRLLRDEAVGERDRARARVAELEADNARLTEALREIQAAIGLPAVVCGQTSMPVRYEKARKAADAALSDGGTR